MLRLDQAFVTTIQKTLGGTSDTVVTDTIFVSDVRIDFKTGALYATLRRGIDVLGQFVENMVPVEVVVNPDGSFISLDGLWSGTAPGVPQLITQLKGQFDQFLLASGAVSGTII
jgi:hypothetical protein